MFTSTCIPCLPASARLSALLFQRCPECPFTWRSHTLSPNRFFNVVHAWRASIAIALCFFAFHVPDATMAAYSESYRITTYLTSPFRAAHCSARVNATSSAKLLVTVALNERSPIKRYEKASRWQRFSVEKFTIILLGCAARAPRPPAIKVKAWVEYGKDEADKSLGIQVGTPAQVANQWDAMEAQVAKLADDVTSGRRL